MPYPELAILFAIDQATDHANDEINRLLIVKPLLTNERVPGLEVERVAQRCLQKPRLSRRNLPRFGKHCPHLAPALDSMGIAV